MRPANVCERHFFLGRTQQFIRLFDLFPRFFVIGVFRVFRVGPPETSLWLGRSMLSGEAGWRHGV